MCQAPIPLEPTSKAEEIARQMLETGDIVINVVNAINLERSLYLTLQLLERDIPVVVALNFWDDTKHRGIKIDLERLRELLGVPVIPTVAVTGEGIKNLGRKYFQVNLYLTHHQQAGMSGGLLSGTSLNRLQRVEHRHHTWLERLQDASVKPLTGGLIAVGVLVCAFLLIRFIGESLINYVLDPLFNNLWAPIILGLSNIMGGGGFLHDIVVGKLAGGEMNFVESIWVAFPAGSMCLLPWSCLILSLSTSYLACLRMLGTFRGWRF